MRQMHALGARSKGQAMSKPDMKVIRERAFHVGDDVDELCDRVEALEKALRSAVDEYEAHSGLDEVSRTWRDLLEGGGQ